MQASAVAYEEGELDFGEDDDDGMVIHIGQIHVNVPSTPVRLLLR